MTSLLETKNKIIDQIQSILQLKEAKNIIKQTIGAVGDLAISYKENNNQGLKKKFILIKNVLTIINLDITVEITFMLIDKTLKHITTKA